MADNEDASVTTSKRLTRPQGRPDLFKQAIRLAWGQEPINAMAMVKQAFTPHVRSRESDLRCIISIPPQLQAASCDVQISLADCLFVILGFGLVWTEHKPKSLTFPLCRSLGVGGCCCQDGQEGLTSEVTPQMR